MKANTHRLCTANRPSPLATPQPPHPPTAPEAASRRGRHGCGATPPRGCRLHHAARAMRHWELAATHWTEFESKNESQGRLAQDFQQVCGPIGTGAKAKAPGVIKKGTGGNTSPMLATCHVSEWHTYAILSGESIKGRQSVAAPLANDFCKSDHLQLSISHFWPFNVAKCCQRNSRDHGPSHSRKKHGLWTNWPNIATLFARRGTQKSLLLSNWSSWRRAASARHWTEFESNTKSSTSPGESSARLPTGPQPHRHLWCHCGSTWSAQKGHGGGYTAPREDGISKKGTFMPSKPQSSEKFRLCGG